MQTPHPSTKQLKADKFWNIFLFVKDGKIKSRLIIYSFSLSIIFLVLYGISYYFLIDPLHLAFTSMPSWLSDLGQVMIPPIVTSALICLIQFLSGNSNYFPAAYVWLLLFGLFVLGWMMISLEAPEDRSFFLNMFLRVVPGPVIVGGASSVLLFFNRNKRGSVIKK